VSFTTRILNGSVITRLEVKANQSEVSFGRVQNGIEAPRTRNLIALQLTDEVPEERVAMLTGYAGAGADDSIEAVWVTRIPHDDGFCCLGVGDRNGANKQCRNEC
jgi:hypothetical protein